MRVHNIVNIGYLECFLAAIPTSVDIDVDVRIYMSVFRLVLVRILSGAGRFDSGALVKVITSRTLYFGMRSVSERPHMEILEPRHYFILIMKSDLQTSSKDRNPDKPQQTRPAKHPKKSET